MSDIERHAYQIQRLLKSWQTEHQPEAKLLHLLTMQTTAVAQAREAPEEVREKLLASTLQQLTDLESLRIHSSPFSYVERYIFKRVLSDLQKHIRSSKARGHVPLY
jgi:hypothetical protein